MRILFHHRVGSRDGQSVHLEELSEALRRQGHEIRIVGPAGFFDTRFGGTNRVVSLVKRMLPASVFELLEIAYNIKAFIQLWAAIKSFRPDVIYERFSLFLFAGIWAAQRSRLPLLLEVNAPLYEERAANDGLKLHFIARIAQGYIWRRADHLLPVTKVLAETIQSYGVPESRIAVIPNGVNLDRFGTAPTPQDAKDQLQLGNRTVLGFTGFIRGWNAVHRMIDFVANHRDELDLHVLVVGDGPARESLETHAREKGVGSRLSITGIVERDDVASHVAAVDIAVLPGVTPYSSPLKLFEYLQIGKAIVAPDMPNIREILDQRQNALLFAPCEPGAFEDALLTLCRDVNLRQALGDAARRTIVKKSLTWDSNARRVATIAEALSAVAQRR